MNQFDGTLIKPVFFFRIHFTFSVCCIRCTYEIKIFPEKSLVGGLIKSLDYQEMPLKENEYSAEGEKYRVHVNIWNNQPKKLSAPKK